MINLGELQPYQEMELAATTTGSAAVVVPYAVPTNELQPAVIEAVGDRITFLFSGAGTVASKTVTNSLLPPGNFSLAAGASMIIHLNPSQNNVSVIAGATTGTGIVKLCKKAG